MSEIDFFYDSKLWLAPRLGEIANKLLSIEGIASAEVKATEDQDGGILVDAKVDHPTPIGRINATRTILAGLAAGKRAIIVSNPNDGGTVRFIVFNETGRWSAPAAPNHSEANPTLQSWCRVAYRASTLGRGNYDNVVRDAAHSMADMPELLANAKDELKRLEGLGDDLSQRCFMSSRHRTFLRDVMARAAQA